MRAERLPRTYARAIYEMALEGWQKNLRAIYERLRAEENLRLSLSDPQLSFDQKRRLLDKIFPPEAGPEVRNFLYLLLKEGRIEMLDDILFEFRELAEKGAGRKVAEISSAVPLTEEEQGALRQRLTARFGPDLDFRFHVEPALLGGVVVRVGDQIMDGTVAGKLEALRQRLRAAQ